jgi:ribosomal subunit interface protein
MIAKIEKSGIEYALNETIATYIDTKLGRLDRFAPKHARQTMHAEVKLRKFSNDAASYNCEAIMHVPGQQLTAQASATSMNAAVDAVEAKLKAQLGKYKDAHIYSRHTHPRGIFKIFSRQTDAPESIT